MKPVLHRKVGDVRGILEEMHELVRCPICRRTTILPSRPSDCHHFFCHLCLIDAQRRVKDGKDVSRCPICRAEIKARRNIVNEPFHADVVGAVLKLMSAFNKDVSKLARSGDVAIGVIRGNNPAVAAENVVSLIADSQLPPMTQLPCPPSLSSIHFAVRPCVVPPIPPSAGVGVGDDGPAFPPPLYASTQIQPTATQNNNNNQTFRPKPFKTPGVTYGKKRKLSAAGSRQTAAAVDRTSPSSSPWDEFIGTGMKENVIKTPPSKADSSSNIRRRWCGGSIINVEHRRGAANQSSPVSKRQKITTSTDPIFGVFENDSKTGPSKSLESSVKSAIETGETPRDVLNKLCPWIFGLVSSRTEWTELYSVGVGAEEEKKVAVDSGVGGSDVPMPERFKDVDTDPLIPNDDLKRSSVGDLLVSKEADAEKMVPKTVNTEKLGSKEADTEKMVSKEANTEKLVSKEAENENNAKNCEEHENIEKEEEEDQFTLSKLDDWCRQLSQLGAAAESSCQDRDGQQSNSNSA